VQAHVRSVCIDISDDRRYRKLTALSEDGTVDGSIRYIAASLALHNRSKTMTV
jgi:hypothetical protein